MLKLNKIYNINCLEGLKMLPDESVDMCITSPPYWALRDYSTEPIIWGGNNNCEHEWETNIQKPKGGRGSKNANVGANKNDFANMRDHNVISYYCKKCGAWKGQLGLEPTFHEYIQHLLIIFDEVKRILKPTGTCWVNLGDTYAGSNKGAWKNKEKQKEVYVPDKKYNIKEILPAKSLCCIPDRFKIAMVDRGWICRNEIIWHKPNAMPQSVKDRFSVDYEKLFFFVKNSKYYFEQQLEPYISQPQKPRDKSKEMSNNGYLTNRFSPGRRNYYSKGGRNKRCVWSINTKPFKEAHFAVYPPELIEIPIRAGCPEGGIILDPFIGSGTTALVAKNLNRNFIGFELNVDYCKIAEKRLESGVA